MIEFVMSRATKKFRVGRFTIGKGKPILKVLFDDSDVHVSRSGKKHLDIWGLKLIALKAMFSSGVRRAG